MRKITLRLSSTITALIFLCNVAKAQYWDFLSATQIKTITTSNVGIGLTTSPSTSRVEIRTDLATLSGLTISNQMSSCATCTGHYLNFLNYNSGTSSWESKLVFTRTGKLGIGATLSPLGDLSIDGTSDATLYIERTNSSTWQSTKVKAGISTNTGPAGLRFQVSSNSGLTWVDALHLANNGRVGIGTTDPIAPLTVNGNIVVTNSSGVGQAVIYSTGYIRAREIQVDALTIPDYVFEKSYKLMTLKELNDFIIANKHLPNVPSASDYAKEGSVAVGELQLKTLEKVEELTLYILQLEQRISELEANLNELKTN